MSNQQQEELNNEFVKSSGGVELPSNLENIGYVFDHDEVDCQYGYTTRRLLLVDNDHPTDEAYDPREFKGVYKDGKFRTLVSRQYAVIPDEIVEEYQRPLIENGELRFLDKTHNHGGLSTTWEFETPTKFKVEKSKDPDDVFGVNVVFRNSINGGIALSASVRTLRQVCINGLTGWGIDFQSRLAHYGKMEEKLAVFRSTVGHVTEMTDKFVALLNRTTEIAINAPMMQYVIHKSGLSKNYIPTWINIEDTSKGPKVLGLNESTQPQNLYEATNDITYLLSRAYNKHPEHSISNGELSLLGITQREQALTKAVQRIVINNGRVPS